MLGSPKSQPEHLVERLRDAPPVGHFPTFSDAQEFLAKHNGGEPFDYSRDNPETLVIAEQFGVRGLVANAIELSRALDPVIDASVKRAARLAAREALLFDRAEPGVPKGQPINGNRSEAIVASPAAIDWHELAGKEPPARRWAISGWLGFGHTSLLVGPGGIGKTLLAQQIGSALAVNQYFIDEVRGPFRTLMWCCEDDHDELWRRQLSVARWLDVDLDAFTDRLYIVPRHGLDNALTTTEFGRVMFTPRLGELREQAEDLRAELVILDNVAQLYGGNENDRHSVTAFLNALAGALSGRAILLLAHPARSAGSEFSGSSAWENTARTRLYLGSHLPDVKPGANEEPADEVRYLARRKANYTGKDWRRFVYRNGVLVPDAVEIEGGMVGRLREKADEGIVLAGLAKLDELGIPATEGSRSDNYLPKLINDYKFSEGRSRTEMGAAMRRLIVGGEIVKVEVGKYSNRNPRYGLKVAHK
jgi:hypothetical protein